MGVAGGDGGGVVERVCWVVRCWVMRRPLGGVEFLEGVVVDGGFVGTVVAEAFAGAGVEVRGAGVGGGGGGSWVEGGGGIGIGMGIGSVPFGWRGVIGAGVGLDGRGHGKGRRCKWEGRETVAGFAFVSHSHGRAAAIGVLSAWVLVMRRKKRMAKST